MHIFIYIQNSQNLSCCRSYFIHLYHLSYYYTCAEIIRCLFHCIITMIGHLPSLIDECTKKSYISFYIAKESSESHVWVHLNFITNLWNFAKCVDSLLMNTMGIIGKSTCIMFGRLIILPGTTWNEKLLLVCFNQLTIPTISVQWLAENFLIITEVKNWKIKWGRLFIFKLANVAIKLDQNFGKSYRTSTGSTLMEITKEIQSFSWKE